jgi:phage repressor protein C with HTH and peptisase S24 domain
MVGDSMELTISAGDLVVARPTDRVIGDKLYVVERLGQPEVVRVSRTASGFSVFYDNPRYSATPYTREQLDAEVIGEVVGVLHWYECPQFIDQIL